ncbi:MAG: hypothetical protein MUO64_10975, partial [Anaerolineales bacterium]|nr:hypothetical protein [Anaerolineales bacterium]
MQINLTAKDTKGREENQIPRVFKQVGCVLNAPFSIIQYNLHMPEYRRSLIEGGTILYSGHLQPSANTHKHRSQKIASVGLDGCAQEI